MNHQLITVVNTSTVVSNDELSQIITAINDVSMPAFAGVWDISAALSLTAVPGAWLLSVEDDTDQPNDLAYHLDENNLPQIRVFARTIQQCGASLCQAIDHEVKEALVNPTAATELRLSAGSLIVKEVCDPVSADGLDLGNGLTGANFVYPAWFIVGLTVGPWDHRGLCTAALETRPGGYKEELLPGATQWQLVAMRAPDGFLNWRVSHHGRLAYRAQRR